MEFKSRIILYLILLAVLDTAIPLPIIGFILIYAVLKRPPWFKDLVQRIYNPQ